MGFLKSVLCGSFSVFCKFCMQYNFELQFKLLNMDIVFNSLKMFNSYTINIILHKRDKNMLRVLYCVCFTQLTLKSMSLGRKWCPLNLVQPYLTFINSQRSSIFSTISRYKLKLWLYNIQYGLNLTLYNIKYELNMNIKYRLNLTSN